MTVVALVRSDWPLWRRRLWGIVGVDPITLTLGQLVQVVYGYLLDGRDRQGREDLDAILEDRLAMSVDDPSIPAAYKSGDPDAKLAARKRLIAEGRRREAANG